MISNGLRATMGVSDLNVKMDIRKNSGNNPPGATHVPRQDAVRATHGFPAMEDVSSHHRSPRWRSLRKDHDLRRSISRFGLCATDLPRKCARYRSLPVGAGRQAFSGMRSHARRWLMPTRLGIGAFTPNLLNA